VIVVVVVVPQNLQVLRELMLFAPTASLCVLSTSVYLMQSHVIFCHMKGFSVAEVRSTRKISLANWLCDGSVQLVVCCSCLYHIDRPRRHCMCSLFVITRVLSHCPNCSDIDGSFSACSFLMQLDVLSDANSGNWTQAEAHTEFCLVTYR